jgi:hypothetical protein
MAKGEAHPCCAERYPTIDNLYDVNKKEGDP